MIFSIYIYYFFFITNFILSTIFCLFYFTISYLCVMNPFIIVCKILLKLEYGNIFVDSKQKWNKIKLLLISYKYLLKYILLKPYCAIFIQLVILLRNMAVADLFCFYYCLIVAVAYFGYNFQTLQKNNIYINPSSKTIFFRIFSPFPLISF